MLIKENSKAGTLESCDVLVTIEKKDIRDYQIEIESSVIKKYGALIKKLVEEKIREMNVVGFKMKLVDRGALDHVILARVETAILRALAKSGENNE